MEYLPRIGAKCKCLVYYPNEKGCFHKALPNVRSTYVTLQDFTPDLQKNYTDISAISVTFRNSGLQVPDVYCVFKTELVVVVGKEVAYWGIVPPNHNCVRLRLGRNHFSTFST